LHIRIVSFVAPPSSSELFVCALKSMLIENTKIISLGD
jgi:hypothetical protein